MSTGERFSTVYGEFMRIRPLFWDCVYFAGVFSSLV
jgi:hypothetical protein